MSPAEENALRLELDVLRKKLEVMQQLATREGFFQYYFKNITNHKNREECFHAVNEYYKELFGQHRYSDYGSFRNTLNRQSKK